MKKGLFLLITLFLLPASLFASPLSLYISSYLGGSGIEDSYGIAVDSSGYVYIAGVTDSGDFPTITPYQRNFQGIVGDVFVAKFFPSGFFAGYSRSRYKFPIR